MINVSVLNLIHVKLLLIFQTAITDLIDTDLFRKVALFIKCEELAAKL